MSDFIRTVNEADRLARLFREARITALELEERLLSLGFFNVEFSPRVIATYVSARIPLGEIA